MNSRCHILDQVADELRISKAQVYALVRRKELRSLKIGGRGQWRVGRDDIEAYIESSYEETARWVDEHPFSGESDDEAANL